LISFYGGKINSAIILYDRTFVRSYKIIALFILPP